MTHYEKTISGPGPGGPWVATLLHQNIQANSTLVKQHGYCGLRICKPGPLPNNHIIIIFWPTTIEHSDAPNGDCKIIDIIDILDTQFYTKIKNWLTYHNITIKDEQWPKA